MKKLILNKEIISNITNDEMKKIKGGVFDEVELEFWDLGQRAIRIMIQVEAVQKVKVVQQLNQSASQFDNNYSNILQRNSK